MMLARQKAMVATMVVCATVVCMSTLAYIFAAERVNRSHVAPTVSDTLAQIIEGQLAAQPDDLFTVQSSLHRMTQHYQIDEVALYDSLGKRLAHSSAGQKEARLATELDNIQPGTDGRQYRLMSGSEDFVLLIRNQMALPEFFYLDTLTTSLVITALSALLVFILYLYTRRWQQRPYEHLLEDIHEAAERKDDGRITLKLRDPDLKPLIEALNDLFWRRNQRHQHLKTAHQQAEHARLRATRLSTETRQMNEDLAKEVSVRRSVEVQLKNTQTLLDGILNAMPSALFALDSRNRIVQCNQQAGDWLDKEYPQLIGLPLTQLIPELAPLTLLPASPAERPRMNKHERIEVKFAHDTITTDILIYPLPSSQQARLVVRIDDVSQRQRMEEIMVQTEKMMTVGGLAAGMAHEINNPLGAILQNLQNARRRLDPTLPANQRMADELELNLELMSEYLQQRGIQTFFAHIQEAGERAAGIVANMLQFSRNDHLQKRDISLAELVETTLNIAHSDLELRHIAVDLGPEPEQCFIHCVPSEIEQVLLNLLRNAQQALSDYQAKAPEGWHPRVQIHGRAVAGEVCLAITDNGPGIPDDIVPHIFEPFYTTKEVGQGTGLGLSVSYFIITAHHQGRLSYRPGAHGGACFELWLPRQ